MEKVRKPDNQLRKRLNKIMMENPSELVFVCALAANAGDATIIKNKVVQIVNKRFNSFPPQ